MVDRTRPLTHASEFAPTDAVSTLSLEDSQPSSDLSTTGASTLSPSLLKDLKRFSEDPVSAELLPVVAASVRHAKSLQLELELDGRDVELTLNPRQQLYYSQIDICALTDQALSRLKLVRIEPHPPTQTPPQRGQRIGSLRPLLWHLALRGAREDLLPEISGPIRCRLAFGISLSGLPMDGATQRLIQRMRAAPVAIEDLLPECNLRRGAIQRIWNALYLQSALMVSRAVPN